jgi:PAS domain S-box-containing protein
VLPVTLVRRVRRVPNAGECGEPCLDPYTGLSDMQGIRGERVVALRTHVHEGLRDAIVSGWLNVLAVQSPGIRERLCGLVARVDGALHQVPFDRADARAIGRDLAQIECVGAESLGPLLEILTEELALPGAHVSTLLGEMTSGFVEGMRDSLASQHERALDAARIAREEAEQALHASEARYLALVEGAVEGVVLADGETRQILDSNRAFQEMLGYSARELVGMRLDELRVEPRAVRRPPPRPDETMEWRCRTQDGCIVTLEGTVTHLTLEGQAVTLSVVRDITLRKQLAQELQEAHRRTAVAREEQRLLLARELHDGPLQETLGLRYQVCSLIGTAEGPGRATLETIAQSLDRNVSTMRRMIADLRPPGLDGSGLPAALENYLADVRCQQQTPRLRLRVDAGEYPLREAVALALFRVTQECVRNALAHARASGVTVHLRRIAGGVALRVADNGIGFELPNSLAELARESHFGLIGVEERVAFEMRGKVHLRSRPGQGTSVTVWVPGGEVRDESGDTGPGR